jgi:hypothetical protein
MPGCERFKIGWFRHACPATELDNVHFPKASDLRADLSWAREVPFQSVHSVSRFLNLHNNLGNLLFARRTTPAAVSDRVLIRF